MKDLISEARSQEVLHCTYIQSLTPFCLFFVPPSSKRRKIALIPEIFDNCSNCNGPSLGPPRLSHMAGNLVPVLNRPRDMDHSQCSFSVEICTSCWFYSAIEKTSPNERGHRFHGVATLPVPMDPNEPQLQDQEFMAVKIEWCRFCTRKPWLLWELRHAVRLEELSSSRQKEILERFTRKLNKNREEKINKECEKGEQKETKVVAELE